MLSNKWFNDRECFTRTRSTNNPSASKWVDDIHPTFTELAFVVVSHRNIDTILILLKFLTLLKAYDLQIEPILQKPFFQEL